MADDNHILTKAGRKTGGGILKPEKVIEMRFEQGLTVGEIADYFGVSPQAVSKFINNLSKASIPGLYAMADDMITKQINAEMLIIGLMQDASNVMTQVKDQTFKMSQDNEVWGKMDIEIRKLHLETMKEIRAQIGVYQEISERLYSHQANAEFQKAVVDAISEESPEVAEKIRKKLSRVQPIREFIGGSRRAG